MRNLDIKNIQVLYMFQAYIILLSAGFCCFIFNRKKLPVYLTPLGFLVGFVLIEELACYSMKRSDINTNPVHHLYQLVELYALGLSYYLYYKGKERKPILKMVPAFFILLGCIYIAISFYAEGIYNESIINFLINSVLMIIFSTHFFYRLYFESTEIKVLSFGFFWVNAGNLIYACGTFFQMGLYTYVRSINPALADDLNMINHVLNYFLYANYLAAFLCTKKYLFS